MGICQYQRPDKSDVGIFKKIAIRRQAPVEDRFRETGEKDMRYDFTKIIDRHGKDAIAVDGLGKNPGFAPEPPKDGFDVIPMWVADMNFETVPTIPKAIMDRAAHPAYGYFSPVEEYYDSIIRWHKIRNNVEGLMPEYIGYENGVLGGVISALTAFAAPGDAVLLHSPTYIGFTKCITENGYKIVHSPLKKDEKGIWRMDYEDMDAKLKANNIHVAIFCSPHNPTGRVWERREIEEAMEVYKNNECVVIADEIWSDLILKGSQHIPTQSISPDARNRTIALYAPSKTFNIAGLQISNIWISNPELRARFRAEVTAAGYSQVNLMGLVACQAAYETGEEWLKELKIYLEGNLDYVRTFLKENLPEIKLTEPEGTYLLWLDFKSLGMKEEQLKDLVENKAKLWLDSGAMFGPDGEGFERINIACPREILKQALTQLAESVHDR